LEIIPVLNKVDLPSAEEVSDDIVDLLVQTGRYHSCVRKNWFRCRKYFVLLSKEFRLQGNVDEPLQAIFDSHYNPFRGIEVIFRVINGEIKRAKD
jgi:GTP-binding protein LepA